MLLLSTAAQAERHGCPHLDKYMGHLRSGGVPFKVYLLKVTGLEDPAIPKRARARFARNLMAEWQKKDGFFTDVNQEACSSISFTFPEARKYHIKSSTVSSLVLEGVDRKAGEHGSVHLSSEKLDSGNVLLDLTFSFKFVDGCPDGGSVVKTVTVLAQVAWGTVDEGSSSEATSSATNSQLVNYAREWEESAGCEKHEADKREGKLESKPGVRDRPEPGDGGKHGGDARKEHAD